MSRPTFSKAIAEARANIREFFMLDRPAASRDMPLEARAEHRAAERRRRPALYLLRRGDGTAGLVLYRDATTRYLNAKVLASGGQPNGEHGVSGLFDAVMPILEREGRRAPAELEQARTLLADSESRDFDHWSASEQEAAGDCLREATFFLSKLVETRTETRLRVERIFRFALAGALFAGLVVGAVVLLTQPKNVALGRPVSASSAIFASSAEQAVNGIHVGELGFHSDLVESPSLTIDLGADYALSSVRVYGRTDCCYDQSVPLSLDISEDGKAFRSIAERTKPFTGFEPWTVKPKRAKARFVRLRRKAAGFLVLAEVEVFSPR
jgi:hypothetical protein